jgi:hypothetical protein
MKRPTGKISASFVKKMIKKIVGTAPSEAEKKEEKKKVIDYFSANYDTVRHCSVHLPIEGRLEIFFDPKQPSKRVSVPVHSAFLVTCTKDLFGEFRLTWSCSMS